MPPAAQSALEVFLYNTLQPYELPVGLRACGESLALLSCFHPGVQQQVVVLVVAFVLKAGSGFATGSLVAAKLRRYFTHHQQKEPRGILSVAPAANFHGYS